MQKQYLPPDLKLAGEAAEVVLGGGGAGTDLFSEDYWDTQEFASDQSTMIES